MSSLRGVVSIRKGYGNFLLYLFLLVFGFSPVEPIYANGKLPDGCQEVAIIPQGLNVILMVDDSDSMKNIYDPGPYGDPRDLLRFRAVTFIVEYLLGDSLIRGVENYVTVQAFGNTVKELMPWQAINQESQDIYGILANVKPSQELIGTDFNIVAEKAFELLRTQPNCNNQPLILVISDLMPGNIQPEEEDKLRDTIKTVLGTCQRLASEQEPVNIFMLAIDERTDPQFPYVDAWDKYFFDVTNKSENLGAVVKFKEENMIWQFETDVMQKITNPPNRSITINTPIDWIKISPYLERATFMFLRNGPFVNITSFEGERDTAREMVSGQYITLFEVIQPEEVNWKVETTGSPVRLLIGENKPHIEVVIKQSKVVVGYPIIIQGRFQATNRNGPEINIVAKWAYSSHPDAWISMGLGNKLVDGREWEMSTSESMEQNYLIKIAATDTRSETEITLPVECEVGSLLVPEIIRVEPKMLLVGNNSTLTVTVNHTNKMPDIQPTMSFMRRDGETCRKDVEPSSFRINGDNFVKQFVFQGIIVPKDECDFLEVKLLGRTVDEILVSDRKEVAFFPTPYPTFTPEPTQTPLPILTPSMPEKYTPLVATRTLAVSGIMLVSFITIFALVASKKKP